ncbi:efflux transporter, RND family, MFP subunit (plasmid) [Ochrobactrum quorumnocens]|uniref:Efflux transporter, RND family, MFP subunit n=1 Tax=Ochrobactrum quorumnocens TaxID=271865 RepID=A0A248UNC7_9HYPH|nr:efflux transporter, RND family, MFP subunit [[Ochrobactrum] quorumnocens]
MAAAAAAPNEPAPRAASAFTAVKAPATWELSFNGLFVPREEVAVGTSLQDQRIASVEVEAGDVVSKGQVLVRLDTGKLDNQVLENEGRVARARAALAQQQTALAQSEAHFERAKHLIVSRTITKKDYDDRQSSLDVAHQAVAAEEAEFKQAEAQLAEARRERARAVIEAPVAGIVSERKARTGALAGNELLVSLIRDGEIELAAEVPESDLSLLRTEQAARVTLPDGTVVSGRIRLVSPRIDRETRLGTAYIALEGKGEALFSGAFGKAEVVVAQRDAIMVSGSALLHGAQPHDASIFVVIDGKAVKRNVELGARQNGRVEIRSGLREGERVIAKAGPLLRDGEPVTTVDVQTP